MINIDDRLLDQLNESELFLIMHIAKRMQSNRMTSWPNLETLAKDTKWDERTVKKWRSSLMDRGFVGMTQRPGKSSVYRFLKNGIGVYMPLENTEGHAEEGGTIYEGGTKNGGAFIASEGGHKMYPEVVNKEVVNKEEKKAPQAVGGLSALEDKKPKREKPPIAQPPQIDLSGCYKHFSDPDKMRALWERWLKYRKDIKKPLKTEDAIVTGLRLLYKWTSGNVATATEIVEKSIGSGYTGLIKPEPPKQPALFQQPAPYKLEPAPERKPVAAYTP